MIHVWASQAAAVLDVEYCPDCCLYHVSNDHLAVSTVANIAPVVLADACPAPTCLPDCNSN